MGGYGPRRMRGEEILYGEVGKKFEKMLTKII